MLITSGKSDYDVKPLKQLFFFGGGGKMHILPPQSLFGGQLPPLPPTSRVHECGLKRWELNSQCNKYVDPPYCRAKMYAGRVAC